MAEGKKIDKEFQRGDVVRLIMGWDKGFVKYRPVLKRITGSANSAILLCQILYWYDISGMKKFFKFKLPCDHSYYKEGDSWCEELEFTRREFDTAIKRIGIKLGKTKNKLKKENAFVTYYTDRNRLTWYDINEERVGEILLDQILGS